MMNPGGPVEEVGATTRSFFDTMRDQPATLAMIVANIAMLVFIFYALTKGAEFREQMLKQQFDFAHKVTDMLARCVVPDRTAVDPSGLIIPIRPYDPKPVEPGHE